mmetsp:Transcript_62180/g.183873  ORF Transcript_62180/g.183873 Transcript_62180/m.183873 type:complete len:239 (-) Transcript_62180:41-757(-)
MANVNSAKTTLSSTSPRPSPSSSAAKRTARRTRLSPCTAPPMPSSTQPSTGLSPSDASTPSPALPKTTRSTVSPSAASSVASPQRKSRDSSRTPSAPSARLSSALAKKTSALTPTDWPPPWSCTSPRSQSSPSCGLEGSPPMLSFSTFVDRFKSSPPESPAGWSSMTPTSLSPTISPTLKTLDPPAPTTTLRRPPKMAPIPPAASLHRASTSSSELLDFYGWWHWMPFGSGQGFGLAS